MIFLIWFCLIFLAVILSPVAVAWGIPRQILFIYSVSGSVLATVLHNSGSDCHVVSTGSTADIFGRMG